MSRPEDRRLPDRPEPMEWTFEEVPPPAAAPVDKAADGLGLLRGLRAEQGHSQYRCANCRGMQPNGSWLVWVPDDVRSHDPDWSVTEACRRSAFNGHKSGWCLTCAQRLGRPRLLGLPSVPADAALVFAILAGVFIFTICALLWAGR